MIHWAVLSGHVLRLVIAFCFVTLLTVNDIRRWTKSGPTSSPLVQAILKSAACLLIGDARPILIWFHVEALGERSQGDSFVRWVLYSAHCWLWNQLRSFDSMQRDDKVGVSGCQWLVGFTSISRDEESEEEKSRLTPDST